MSTSNRYPDWTRRSVLTALAATALGPQLGRSALAAGPDEEIRLSHAWGDIVLPRPAQRVVSLGYTTHDTILALGVVPLAVRFWFGDFSDSIWPWARPLLGDAKPVVLTGEVAMEQVAALQPDLIVGIGSGISQAEYEVLSHIAPVLMHPEEGAVYGTPWDTMLEMIGKAVGKTELASDLISGVKSKFAAARERHPEWLEMTGVAASHWSGETSAFIGEDTRAQCLAELGFRPPEKVASLSSASGFYATLSPEDLSPLDADVLVWISSYDEAPDLIDLPMRKTLKAYSEGREVFAGQLLAAAMSFGSVLSLPYVLEHMEADIAAAADGDPSTVVASAAKAGLAPEAQELAE